MRDGRPCADSGSEWPARWLRHVAEHPGRPRRDSLAGRSCGGELSVAEGAVAAIFLEVLAPGRLLHPRLEHPLVAQRPAVVVMVELGPEDEGVHQRRPHEDVLDRL